MALIRMILGITLPCLAAILLLTDDFLQRKRSAGKKQKMRFPLGKNKRWIDGICAGVFCGILLSVLGIFSFPKGILLGTAAGLVIGVRVNKTNPGNDKR